MVMSCPYIFPCIRLFAFSQKMSQDGKFVWKSRPFWILFVDFIVCLERIRFVSVQYFLSLFNIWTHVHLVVKSFNILFACFMNIGVGSGGERIRIDFSLIRIWTGSYFRYGWRSNLIARVPTSFKKVTKVIRRDRP